MSQQSSHPEAATSTAGIIIFAFISLFGVGVAGGCIVLAPHNAMFVAYAIVSVIIASGAVLYLTRELRQMQDAAIAHLETEVDYWHREATHPPRRKNVIPADVAELTAEIAGMAREAGHLAARVIEASASLSARTSDMGEDFAEVLADRDKLRKRAALVDEIRKVADQAEPLADAPTPSAWPSRPMDFADRRPPEEFAPPAEREAMRALQQAIGPAT